MPKILKFLIVFPNLCTKLYKKKEGKLFEGGKYVREDTIQGKMVTIDFGLKSKTSKFQKRKSQLSHTTSPLSSKKKKG